MTEPIGHDSQEAREGGTELRDEAEPGTPGGVGFSPVGTNDPSTGDVEAGRAAGGGLAGDGAVEEHGSDEGLHQAPVGEDPVASAERDFMNLNRSSRA